MKIIKYLLDLAGLNGKKEAQIAAIYEKRDAQIDDLNDTLKTVNKLLYSKTVTYYIVKSMGGIKPNVRAQ